MGHPLRPGEAAKGWEQLGVQAAGNTRAAWHLMRTDPAPAARTERHHRLKGELARGEHRGEPMDRWQIEVVRREALMDCEEVRDLLRCPVAAGC
ncbi:hypothetical protein ACFC4G_48130 [Streptomyces sp. NPDC056002]|uniref:hypothetical protein n=1 Tax=Streptomyces sp. NPDC056002 TaxID=3345675 RepID=UPI0035D56EFE